MSNAILPCVLRHVKSTRRDAPPREVRSNNTRIKDTLRRGFLMSKRITLKRQMELLEDYAKRLDLATDNSTIAGAAGISISVLHDIRSGVTNDPRIETMKKIADYYQVDLNYFELETEGACTTYLTVRGSRLKGIKVEMDDKAAVIFRSEKGQTLTAEGLRQIQTMIEFITNKETTRKKIPSTTKKNEARSKRK